jgi:hypothetical protein
MVPRTVVTPEAKEVFVFVRLTTEVRLGAWSDKTWRPARHRLSNHEPKS